MIWRAALGYACIAALPVLFGCERVGRSLVDRFEPLESHDGGPPVLAGCRELLCEDAGPPPAAFGGEPLVAPDLSECEPCEGGGCPELTDLETLAALGDDATLSCTRQHLRVGAEPGPSSVTLRAPTFAEVELTVETLRPIELVLEAADLKHVMLGLDGPVRLVIRTPGALSDVQVRGKGGPAGTPSVLVEHHVANELRVGSPEERFEGRVTLERVAVEDAQVVAQDLRLESTTFYDGLIDADSLSAADTDLDTVELRVGEGQMVAGRVRDLALTRCGRIDLLGMDSNESRLGPCSEGPMRVFESFIVGGMLDGPIETEVSDFSRVRFGLREETRLTLWTGAVYSSAFCAHMGRTELGGYASCVACAERAFESGPLCHPHGNVEQTNNFCEALWSMPVCEDPTDRPRPPHGRRDDDMPPPPADAGVGGGE